MSLKIGALLLSICSWLISNGNLSSKTHFQENEPIAINIEDLEFTKSGIFLHLNGDYVQLETIIGQNADEMIGFIRNPFNWICKDCSHRNPWVSPRCSVCGAPKPYK